MCIVLVCVAALLAAVTAQNDICRGFSTFVVTINEGAEPYWYQKRFGPCVDGSLIKGIEVQKLTFPPDFYYGRKVLNFPLVTEIFLDNSKVNKTPIFKNLPKLKQLSLSNNNIYTIHNDSMRELPVELVSFSRNFIHFIEDNAFPGNVRNLYLTCNQLEEMSPKWFTNPSSIESLQLGGNKLTTVPAAMFKDFTSLKSLQLRNNQLITIEPGAFIHTPSLQHLHLGYNNLSEILPDVFANPMSLEFLDVQYNRLSFLHQALMDRLAVKEFKMWANPWQCPCRENINNWIQKSNKNVQIGVSRDGDPSCVIALSFSDKCVPFVDNELYKTFLENFQLYPVKIC